MNPGSPGPVFITGGSAGIGRALAVHHASRGGIVGVTGRRAQALDALCAEWPGRIVPIVADVRDAPAMHAQATQFMDRHGCPTLVYANDGISVGTLTEQSGDAEVFREIMDTNVLGLMQTFAPFLPQMQARGSGTLVGIASVAGLRGLPGAGAYAASKAGAVSLTKTLGEAWARDGIRVVGLAPGLVDTKLTKVTTEHPERREGALRAIPLGRMGTPQDMAGAALFLASPLAAYVVGQTLIVDGGLSL